MVNFKSLTIACLMLVVTPAQAAIDIFACEPEWAALSEELGAGKVTVYSATRALQDVHRIQARPSLIAKMRRADLVVCTGAELEVGWLPLLLQRAGNRGVLPGQPGYFMAAEQVALLDVPETVDRSMGDIHADGNPHVHLDPRRLLAIAETLAQRMSEIDPDNASAYRSSLTDFSMRWRTSMERWQQQARPLKGLTVVVHHKDWRYLLDWLGMTAVATLEPKPGLPPTAAHLSGLTRQMQQQPAALILHAAYQQARPSEWLSGKTGIPVVRLPYTVGGSDEATDLFGLFEATIESMLGAVRQ